MLQAEFSALNWYHSLLYALILSTVAGLILLPQRPFEQVVLGMAFAFSVSLIAWRLGTVFVSVPFGIALGMAGGLSSGLVFGWAEIGQATEPGIYAALFSLGFASSFVLTEREPGRLAVWLGGLIASMAVGVLVLGLGWITGEILARFFPDNYHGVLQFFSVFFMVTGFLAWHLTGWRARVFFMLMLLVLAAFLLWLNLSVIPGLPPETASKRLLQGIGGGVANTLGLFLLFALPYLAGKRFAGSQAGGVAGLLGTGGFALFIMPTYWQGLIFFTLLGLSYPLWRYGLFSLWNLALTRWVAQSAQERHPRLRWHSAWWDNAPPRWGLAEYFSLLCRYFPAETEVIGAKNLASRQALAAAYLEQEAQHLECCRSIQDITRAHEKIRAVLVGLDMPAAHWLGNLRQSSRELAEALAERDFYSRQARLKELIRFLSGLSAVPTTDQASLRFYRLTLDWQQRIRAHLETLLAMQELPNPYIYGIPLGLRAEVFVGRHDLGRRIGQLAALPKSPAILLYGQRRSGKTSLLKNLPALLPAQVWIAPVDCQHAGLTQAHGHAAFLSALARQIQQALADYPGGIFALPPESAFRRNPFGVFETWLDSLGDKRLLLALDEFVEWEQAFSTGRLQVSAVLGMLRNFIQHRPNFSVLLTCSHTFAELEPYWASYLINAQTLHLGALSEDEARQLIAHPLADFPLRYSELAQQRVLSLTAGQPALVQLLCSEIVEGKNQQRDLTQRLWVDVTDVEAAIPQALQLGSVFFSDISRNQVNTGGQAILFFIANFGEGAIISTEILRLKFPDTNLTPLLYREILKQTEKGYSFRIELIRRWFAT